MILEFRNDGEQSLQLHGVQAVQEEAFVIMEDAPLLGNTRHHQDDLSQQFGMKFLNPPSSSPSQFLGSETHEDPSQGWSFPQWRWGAGTFSQKFPTSFHVPASSSDCVALVIQQVNLAGRFPAV